MPFLICDEMGLQFGLDKCATISILRGKVQDSPDIHVTQDAVIKNLRNEESYKYLGILELQETLQERTKKSTLAEYTDRVAAVLDSQLCAKKRYAPS